jgi:hypothetical protein
VAICRDTPVFIRESGIINVHFQGATPDVLVKTTSSNSASFPHTLIHRLVTEVSLTVDASSAIEIHLTPGSRRNSASARGTQILAGVNKHMKVLPPAPEAPLDSPPSTPPALELAVVPHIYSASEPSPPLSASSYPPSAGICQARLPERRHGFILF